MKKPSSSTKHKIKSILTTSIGVIALVILVDTFGSKGFWGFIIILFIFTGIRAAKRWDSIMIIVRYIESMFWGKPLDREMWEKGELKTLSERRKLKFVWRKKDVNDTKRSSSKNKK